MLFMIWWSQVPTLVRLNMRYILLLSMSNLNKRSGKLIQSVKRIDRLDLVGIPGVGQRMPRKGV